MYIIRNKNTQDYISKMSYTNDINKARTFNEINHCKTALNARRYDKIDYEIFEVEIKLK